METWEKITYAPNYQVSNIGNIKSKTNRLLFINYERLKKTNTRARPGLSIDGKLCQYYLHRIVAEHFIENPQNLPEVNHIDGDFYNNAASNLEWVSKLDNMRHASENKLIKRYTTKVKVTTKSTSQVKIYDSMKECSKDLTVSNSKISQCCRKKAEHALYIFEYEDSQRRVINEDGVIWKEFPECDIYIVSNTGEVKNKKTNNVLNPCIVNGYKFVSLRKNNNQLNRLVHRMVAMTFLENPYDLPVVDHVDRDELNNHVDNLRWCTYKENMNNPSTVEYRRTNLNNRV